MKPMKLVGFLSGAAALTLTTGAIADNLNDISKEDLMQRVLAAEARIDQIEASNDSSWITEQRAEEMRNLVYDVLADADTRASLLQSGITAGYDEGAVLGSTDGNWLLKTNLLMQQRFIYNNQDGSASRDSDGDGQTEDNRYGFENTRTKFIMSGHVVSPEWFYRVDINVGSAGSGRTGTLNAYLGYDYGNGWSVQIGSMKTPLLREELVEAQYQLAVERSNVNYAFTGGYADGIMASYQGDQFGLDFMFSDGVGTGQTNWVALDTDYAFTVRGEWLAMGNWDQFMDFTSMQGSETGVLVGGAFHYETGESDTFAEDVDLWIVTGDVSVEGDGWNIYAAVIYSDIDFGVAGVTDLNSWGVVVQGGYYVTEQTELFARYEWADPDISGIEDISILTLGFNHYFSGHNAKWTTDVGIGIDAVNAGVGVNGSPANITGFRRDIGNNDGQVVVRTQLQILF